MSDVLAVVVGLVASVTLAGPVLVLLRRAHVLDVPNPRSSHTEPTPRGGGLAVLAGITAGLAAGSAPGRAWVVLAGALLAAAVGFADDLRELSADLRLLLQAVVAGGLAWVLVRDVDASVPVTVAWAALCVLWLTGYVNAFNFMDGIDGIAAVSAAAAGAWFLLVGREEGLAATAIGGAALLGAAVGFLPWNVPRARIFLGDVGSYGVGLFVACLAVLAVVGGVHPFVASAPLLVYVADTGWTLVARVRRGEPWREAHRDHVYQRLAAAGLVHAQVTALVLLVTALVCAAAWFLPVIPGLAVAAAVLAAYVALPRLVPERGPDTPQVAR